MDNLEILLNIIRQHNQDKISRDKLRMFFCSDLEDRRIPNNRAIELFQETLKYALDNGYLRGSVDGYKLKV